jgi:hypothetical protein
MPPIGTGFDVEQRECDAASVQALEALSPQALVLIGRLDAPQFETRAAEIACLAARCNAAVELQLIVPPTREPSRELQSAASILRRAGVSPKSVLVCPGALLRAINRATPGPICRPLRTITPPLGPRFRWPKSAAAW